MWVATSASVVLALSTIIVTTTVLLSNNKQLSNAQTMAPTIRPRMPTAAPSISVSPDTATFSPSNGPTSKPSIKPKSVSRVSNRPTLSPTYVPSAEPTTSSPSAADTTLPSYDPSLSSSDSPVALQTTSPSIEPTVSSTPTTAPSIDPTYTPTDTPTSSAPSTCPSSNPSEGNKQLPNAQTMAPTIRPRISTAAPSISASPDTATFSPSNGPTSKPSIKPKSVSPVSNRPTLSPTYVPSAEPTTSSPSAADTTLPSYDPSLSSSDSPVALQTTSPSIEPTVSFIPTTAPSIDPTYTPTDTPTSSAPSTCPSSNPSAFSSMPPQSNPSQFPVSAPTDPPVSSPSFDSAAPSTAQPSRPSRAPYSNPSIKPTRAPTLDPTRKPTRPPSIYPTYRPTRFPSIDPTYRPTRVPTLVPTYKPSMDPTYRPSRFPSALPSSRPSTASPSCRPTTSPSAFPSIKPKTAKPSRAPAYYSAVPSISFESSKSRVWSSQGGNQKSSRHLDVGETIIRESNIGKSLGTPTFFWNTNGSVQTAPGVFNDYVIFPTSVNGNLTCFNKSSGNLIWQRYFADYYSPARPGVFSRTSPVFYNGVSFFMGIYSPADIMKINIVTGALEGRVRLQTFGIALVLQSGTLYNDQFLVGTASFEEGAASRNDYDCCLFGGTFHSINAKTMAIMWTWRSIPLALTGLSRLDKLSGAPIWGSSPAVDAEIGVVYIATGNSYDDNPSLKNCTAAFPVDEWEAKCNAVLYPEFWFNSVVAINITTGKTIWGKRMSAWDSWNYACRIKPMGMNCPPFPGTDADFGMEPVLSTFGDGVTKVLYISQKDGVSYCLNVTDGSVIWAYQSSPGGHYGGHNWGISVDDKYVYVGIINQDLLEWTLNNGTVFRGGGWAALDKVTGDPVWTTANPAAFDVVPGRQIDDPLGNGRSISAFGAGPPLSVGDVLLVGSADCIYTPNARTYNPTYGSGGYVYALSKIDGSILSSFETKASVYGGFSADWNCAYVGSGGNYGRGFSVGKGVYVWCV